MALLDGRFADVEPLLRSGNLDMIKPNFYLSYAWYYLGRKAQAESVLAQGHAPTMDGFRDDAVRASLLAADGRRKEAYDLLRPVVVANANDHHTAYAVGVALAQLGETEEALRWLKRSVEKGFLCYPWYARDPLLKPLRGNPEFEQLLEELRRGWQTAKARFGSHTAAP